MTTTQIGECGAAHRQQLTRRNAAASAAVRLLDEPATRVLLTRLADDTAEADARRLRGLIALADQWAATHTDGSQS